MADGCWPQQGQREYLGIYCSQILRKFIRICLEFVTNCLPGVIWTLTLVIATGRHSLTANLHDSAWPTSRGMS